MILCDFSRTRLIAMTVLLIFLWIAAIFIRDPKTVESGSVTNPNEESLQYTSDFKLSPQVPSLPATPTMEIDPSNDGKRDV